MSEFFIRRPIVAIVIAVFMVLIGTICIIGLPIAQYPNIVPPEIQVRLIIPARMQSRSSNRSPRRSSRR